MPPASSDLELVRSALSGDRAATRKLVATLSPAIQQQVVRLLLTSARARRGTLRAETEEWVQEVWLLLFRQNGRVLRLWDPKRGASLTGFASLVARRHVRQQLSVKRRAGPPIESQPLETLELHPPVSSGGESAAAERDQVQRLLQRMSHTLSPRAEEMFRYLFVEAQPVADIADHTGLSPEAIYKWRSRLRGDVAQAATQLGLFPNPEPTARN